MTHQPAKAYIFDMRGSLTSDGGTDAAFGRRVRGQAADGLREWLDYAHARQVPCAVVTDGPKAAAVAALDSLGLQEDFAAVVDESMYARAKPDPEGLLKAAALLGVAPALCRFYGADADGIRAAVAAGMGAVGLAFADSREVLEAAGAYSVIDSYRELKIWPVRPVRTAADDAAIACLDRLRTCAGEEPPVVPLVCVVRVTAVEDVPKARERYAMATVETLGSKTWRVCVQRGTVQPGEDALFVTPDVAFPNEPRFREAFHMMERVYRYGFGVSERLLQPHLSRNIYRNNPGLLCPISRFPELCPMMDESSVMRCLKLQTVAEIRARAQAQASQPKRNVFRPAGVGKAKKKPLSFLERVRRYRARFDEATRGK